MREVRRNLPRNFFDSCFLPGNAAIYYDPVVGRIPNTVDPSTTADKELRKNWGIILSPLAHDIMDEAQKDRKKIKNKKNKRTLRSKVSRVKMSLKIAPASCSLSRIDM